VLTYARRGSLQSQSCPPQGLVIGHRKSSLNQYAKLASASHSPRKKKEAAKTAHCPRPSPIGGRCGPFLFADETPRVEAIKAMKKSMLAPSPNSVTTEPTKFGGAWMTGSP